MLIYLSHFDASYDYAILADFESKRYGDDNDKIKTKGLLVGSLTALLDDYSTALLGTVYYYDQQGRVIQNISKNHLDGYDKEYINYSFTGKPLWKKNIHTTANYGYTEENPLEQTYTYLYDHADRLIETKYKEGTYTQLSLSKLEYDELGRIEKKTLHKGKMPIEYSYNIRDWVKGISSMEFSQNLYYYESFRNNTPSYNGNISAMDYYQGNATQKGFVYTYDNLNRLTKSADFSGSGLAAISQLGEEMTYDKMGNIISLKRRGSVPLNSGMMMGGVLIDNLMVSYNGNQLKRVEDSAYPTDGFIGNNTSGDHYTYNKNGAMTVDHNKGIIDIEYNELNLPNRIYFNNDNTTGYLYDAGGVKRQVVHTTSSYVPSGELINIGPNPGFPPMSIYTQTDYCGPVIYENRKIKRILTPEGYLSPKEERTNRGVVIGGEINPIQSDYDYNYFINDYLGNVRAVLTWNEESPLVIGSSPSAYALSQRNDYYAFGLPTLFSTNSETQPYKREGKEYDEMHGLNTYDQGARQFNTHLPITTTPDPLAEKYYSISPYAQWANNPIKYMDPTGKWIVGTDGEKVTYTHGMPYGNGWSDNASDDVIRVGNALLQTPTGTARLSFMLNHEEKISITISPEAPMEGGKYIGASNLRTGQVLNNNATITVGEHKMTIYEGSLERLTESELESLYKGLTMEEAIGAVAGHESGHMEKENTRRAYENVYEGASHDNEKGPNEIENQIIKETHLKNNMQ